MVTPRQSAGACASRLRSFALVDCIVATVMLGVSLSVIIGLAGRAISEQSKGEHLQTAAMLADEQLHLVLSRGPDDYARRFAVDGACDAPFTNYTYKLAFSGGASVGDPYQVACTVTWNAGDGERSVTIDTLMAARTGLADTQPDPIRTPQTSIIRTP